MELGVGVIFWQKPLRISKIKVIHLWGEKNLKNVYLKEIQLKEIQFIFPDLTTWKNNALKQDFKCISQNAVGKTGDVIVVSETDQDFFSWIYEFNLGISDFHLTNLRLYNLKEYPSFSPVTQYISQLISQFDYISCYTRNRLSFRSLWTQTQLPAMFKARRR